MDFIRCLLKEWTWRMAWRDSRRTRRSLLLCSSSIVLGIAALAAVGSLGSNLRRAVDDQAKTLMGADLIIGSQQAFNPAQEKLLAGLGGEQAREISLATMVYFPKSQGTRLAQIRAIDGAFPFYGRIETDPPSAADRWRGGGALVEESLLNQFNARIGDSIQFGTQALPIVGRLTKVPGESAVFASIAPRIYVPYPALRDSGLIREGSLARYQAAFRFPPEVDVPKKVEAVKAELDAMHLRHETVEDRKRELGRSMENLYHFLNLAGITALLLGGVGVASAIHVHVRQKLPTVAVLRCLGASRRQAFAIYIAQATGLGAVGAVVGCSLGVALGSSIPVVARDLIPFEFEFHTAWGAVAISAVIGLIASVLFATFPLLAVRRVSPLAALRISYESPPGGADRAPWIVGGILVAALVAFSLWQSNSWRVGLGFVGGLLCAFLVLAATAKLLAVATRRFLPPLLPFAVRQGLANLHRPNNRTMVLLLSLGLGTFLMCSMSLVQRSLLAQLASSERANQSNTILFDVQTSQAAGVADLLRSLGLPLLDDAPIVTMRLSSIRGRSIASFLAEKSDRAAPWALRREYRSSYSDRLRGGERIVAGTWVSSLPPGAKVIPISVETGIAKDLRIGLGDELVFDVQGLPLKTRVESLREVDWWRIQPNFFVLFPKGVLEGAPTMRLLVTRVASPDQSAKLQVAVVRQFPNVSVIDLTMVLQTLDSVVKKVAFVVR
ncbi:MAG: ABC transporter permease, partial [Verrucomicrobiae bacterium]|nr:ABC transporter permease [Verrucomicrobiae bacterium]